MREAGGAWVGWPGAPGDAPEPFDAGRHAPGQRGPVRRTRSRDYYEGFCNATLWPLYHDVIAPPEFHRAWWDAYVRVNQRFAEAAAAQAAHGRDRVGARLPAPAGPRHAARAAQPTCGSASSTTSRSPATRSSPSCPGGGRSSRACSARTCSASSASGDATNFLRACRRSAGLATHGRRSSGSPHAGRRPARDGPRRAPSRSRSTRRASRSSPGGRRSRPGPRRSGRHSASRTPCCSASTGSTTPRASCTG